MSGVEQNTQTQPAASADWFRPEQGPALRDFWNIYLQSYDAITAETVRVILGHAELGPWVREMESSGQGSASDRRALLQRAVDGDWATYERALREEGKSFSKLGVSFRAWSDITFAVERQFTPLMVKAYGADLPRLSAALLAMQEFLARRAAVLGESFLAGERAAEGRFRGLLEAAPDAMVIVDTKGRIVFVNGQTERLFGFQREDLLSQSVELLIPERFRDQHLSHRNGYFSAPNIRAMGSGLELFGLRSDGTEFPIEISLSPLETPEGKLVSSAIRDISERKRTDNALLLANRELEAFSYSVAHDLRAPLRGMSGFAQVLIDDYRDKLDEEGLDCLKEIHDNALRMGSLIDALLLLSRVTRSELNPQRTDLTAVARAVVTRLSASGNRPGLQISVQEGLAADLDSNLAHQLVENLLSNAWKFTSKKPAPRIEFGALQNPGSVVFFVRDNGAGFDMAHAGKLFSPFQRLHTVGEYPGTGIGLATAQRIVHRHGGRIWADGSLGAGATFYFTVPERLQGNPA